MQMKKGIFTLALIILTGLLFLGVGALIAADLPEEIAISSEGYKADKKGPVNLSHKKHAVEYKASCNECHHVYKDGKNVWTATDPVQKCGECHNPLKSEGKVKKLQTAYHKNCKDCHKAAAKEGKDAPYKKCNDCHEKKS